MRHPGPAELLLEPDRELDSLRAVLQGAEGGGGRLALVEGPAGIGKSRLLAELRRAAREDDVRVLAARGSELERKFPFGVVRQLFEPSLTNGEARERWLAAPPPRRGRSSTRGTPRQTACRPTPRSRPCTGSTG